VRLPILLEWLARNPVDVLAMQETKLTDEDFPRAEFEALGYHVLVADRAFAEVCTACVIDREPRKAERPSDHTPVIADFAAPP